MPMTAEERRRNDDECTVALARLYGKLQLAEERSDHIGSIMLRDTISIWEEIIEDTDETR